MEKLYSPTKWVNDVTPINQENLNKIEQGLVALDERVIEVNEAVEGKAEQTEVSELKETLVNHDEIFESGVDVGALSAEYVEEMTDTNIAECTTSLSGYSQFYGNGYSNANEMVVNGLKFADGFASNILGIMVFGADGNIVQNEFLWQGEIDTENKMYFSEPITLEPNGYILVANRVAGGGAYKYLNTGNTIYKEYNSSSGSLSTTSPIKAGFDYIVQGEASYAFVDNHIGTVELSNYTMPKTQLVDGEYYYIGRWYDRDGYKGANADGSSIMFRISGVTSFTVNFETESTPNYTPYFAISVDGSEFVRHKITDNTITLADTREHNIWIVVDGMGETDPSESWKWTGTIGLIFKGVNGGTKRALKPLNRQMLFIGDSMVEGINVLGNGANADVNSAVNGFAFKTARKLNAIPLMCGYGGTSTIAMASFADAVNAIDYNYSGVPVNEMNPDIIFIEHGYNDNAEIDYGSRTLEQFVEAYTTLIEHLSIKYSGCQIFCMIPFTQSLASNIREIASGFPNCHVIETSGYGVTYSDGVHLNVNGANIASEKLSNAIMEVMGKQYFID